MKTRQRCLSLLLVILCSTLSPLRAATIINSDPAAGGIGYIRQVQLGMGDSGSFARHVGAWSWEDNQLFDSSQGEPPVGWTHTSDWVALTLTNPTTLTIRVERQADVPSGLGVAATDSMFPSFTIWSNWDNDDADFDTYNNRGSVSWAEDLVYIGHMDNSTQTMVEKSFVLPAGLYTVVLGSNAPATSTTRQGYLATFTTVPEPASGVIIISGLVFIGCLRSRSRTIRR